MGRLQSNSGTCERSRLVRMAEVEQRVLVSLERDVLTERLFTLAVNAYREEFARAQGDRGAMHARLEGELIDVQKKFDRLLRLVEEGHADPAVAGPRLNELATKKRAIAGELALRPDDAPTVPAGNSAESYRKLVEGLRLKTLGGEADEQEAAGLVRGLVRRVVVMPREDDEPQGIEVEAGSSPIGVNTDRDCNVGCGGMQRTISDGSWPSSFFNKTASVPSTSIASG